MSGGGLPPAQDVVEEALEAAAPGSDGCVVIVEETSEVEVRFANNTTTTNGSRRDRRVTVVCLRASGAGTAAGVARSGGVVDVAELVRAAESDARGSPPAGDAFGLPEPGAGAGVAGGGAGDTGAAWPSGTGAVGGAGASSRPSAAGVAAGSGAGVVPPSSTVGAVPPSGAVGAVPPSGAVGAFDDPPALTDLSVLGGVLSDLSGAFGRAHTGGYVLAGFAEHGRATGYLGTSTGVRLAHAQPTGALHLVGRSDDGSRSTWAGAGTADFTDVSIGELEVRLRDRLEWAATSLDRPAGRYEVVLPPEAVADLMISLAFECGGRDAEDGRTVFSGPTGATLVGSRLSSLPFDLWSDPAEPGLECAPFLTVEASGADASVFDNGLPLSRTDWIAGGRLERLRYHRAGAARSGVQPAAYIDNLVLDVPNATGSLEELVARTERGLLLTCLWYIREVDPATMLLTGLTRDGVYVVEDGEVVGACNNFRFNESPVDLLARATEVGTSVRALGREYGEYLNRSRMPPMRIGDFNMSSVSRAS